MLVYSVPLENSIKLAQYIVIIKFIFTLYIAPFFLKWIKGLFCVSSVYLYVLIDVQGAETRGRRTGDKKTIQDKDRSR